MNFSEKRAESISIAKEALSSVFNGDLIGYYLNIQSDFKDFSVLDSLYLAKTNPDERVFKSFNDWNSNEEIKIKSKAEGTVFPRFGTGAYFTKNQTEPVFKKGKSKDKSDAAKNNTTGKETVRLTANEPKNNFSLRYKMRALLANNQTRLGITENPERTNGKAAYFDAEFNAVIVNKNSPPEEIYRQLAEELSHAEFAHSDNEYTRKKYEPLAQMSSYVVCRRNDIKHGTITLPDDYKNLSDDEITDKLETVKFCSDKLSDNIEYYCTNGRDKQPRYTPKLKIELDETKKSETQRETKTFSKNLTPKYEAKHIAVKETKVESPPLKDNSATEITPQSELLETKEQTKSIDNDTAAVSRNDRNTQQKTPVEVVIRDNNNTQKKISFKSEMEKKKYEAKHGFSEDSHYVSRHTKYTTRSPEWIRESEKIKNNMQGELKK